MPVRLSLHVPRHAFSVRERARAADLWRAFQEAAVLGSSAVGWPPPRYREEACAFVVRRMTVVHQAEVVYGEPVQATTWVRDFRRGLLTTREIRLTGEGGRALAAASQEWVHVAFGVDAAGAVTLKPSRAKPHLLAAFPEEDHDVAPVLPVIDTPAEGPTHRWSFPLWHTAMDPLGHVNHPAYLDICDEHTTRLLVAGGVDPVQLQPVAEEVGFRGGLDAPGPATVETRLVGRTAAGHCVFAHRIFDAAGALAADATTVRTLAAGDPDRLADASTLEPLEAP